VNVAQVVRIVTATQNHNWMHDVQPPYARDPATTHIRSTFCSGINLDHGPFPDLTPFLAGITS
jgi:hypothetical protein